MSRIFCFFLAAALLGAPAAAQSVPEVAGAIAAGQAGERFDGYMGFVTTPSPELRRQISGINIRRRNLYLELASKRNVTADLVGMATACELFSRLSPGEAYMLNDHVWRRRAPGQSVPLPDYCH